MNNDDNGVGETPAFDDNSNDDQKFNLPFGFNPFGAPGKGAFNEDILSKMNQFGLSANSFFNANSASGAINKDQVLQIAKQSLNDEKNENKNLSIGNNDISQAIAAFEIANLWLDESIYFPNNNPTAAPAWSRVDWLEASIDSWVVLIDPLAQGMLNALVNNLSSFVNDEDGINSNMQDLTALGIPSDFFSNPQFITQIKSMMGNLIGTMIGNQLGQALGQVATRVNSAHDTSIPIFQIDSKLKSASQESDVHLIPQNISNWSTELGIRSDEIRIFLATREAAAARLFAHTPWLFDYFKNALNDYGSSIKIDFESMNSQTQQMFESGEFDPSNPESFSKAISSGLFTPSINEHQNKALEKIDMMISLIEGWIDHITQVACAQRLPSYALLNETLRRSRITNSSLELIFKSLLGLEISPRRIRECTMFWSKVLELNDSQFRDKKWEESILLPTDSDLKDVGKYLSSFEVPDDLSGLFKE